MTTSGAEQFESLLANRARIGFGVPVHTPRPSMSALYEFGGGYPDPESFPYEGMIEATKQPAERLCQACFTGRYPIELPDERLLGKHLLEASSYAAALPVLNNP